MDHPDPQVKLTTMPLVTQTAAKGIPPKVRQPKRKGKLTTKKNKKGKTNKNGKRPTASEEDEDLESLSDESELPLGIVMGCCTRPGTAGYGYGLGLSNPGHTRLAGRGRGGTFTLRAKSLSMVNPNDARGIVWALCRYFFLFIYYFLTNHAGSRRPTMANEGYIFLFISYFLTNHAGSRRPTTRV